MQRQMRKRRITQPQPYSSSGGEGWLDLEPLVTVEVTSEDPSYPVEGALLPGNGGGWRAGEPGPQTLRLIFDEPQRLRRIHLEFVEPAVERTQEFLLRWSVDAGKSFQEIVRQQWNFSPDGAPREVEDYQVDLAGITTLELRIEPDSGRGSSIASLSQLRLA